MLGFGDRDVNKKFGGFEYSLVNCQNEGYLLIFFIIY